VLAAMVAPNMVMLLPGVKALADAGGDFASHVLLVVSAGEGAAGGAADARAAAAGDSSTSIATARCLKLLLCDGNARCPHSKKGAPACMSAAGASPS